MARTGHFWARLAAQEGGTAELRSRETIGCSQQQRQLLRIRRRFTPDRDLFAISIPENVSDSLGGARAVDFPDISRSDFAHMAVVVNDEGLAAVAECHLAIIRAALYSLSILPEESSLIMGNPIRAGDEGGATLRRRNLVHKERLLRSGNRPAPARAVHSFEVIAETSFKSFKTSSFRPHCSWVQQAEGNCVLAFAALDDVSISIQIGDERLIGEPVPAEIGFFVETINRHVSAIMVSRIACIGDVELRNVACRHRLVGRGSHAFHTHKDQSSQCNDDCDGHQQLDEGESPRCLGLVIFWGVLIHGGALVIMDFFVSWAKIHRPFLRPCGGSPSWRSKILDLEKL